jgi:hypothetical protein
MILNAMLAIFDMQLTFLDPGHFIMADVAATRLHHFASTVPDILALNLFFENPVILRRNESNRPPPPLICVAIRLQVLTMAGENGDAGYLCGLIIMRFKVPNPPGDPCPSMNPKADVGGIPESKCSIRDLPSLARLGHCNIP